MSHDRDDDRRDDRRMERVEELLLLILASLRRLNHETQEIEGALKPRQYQATAKITVKPLQ